MQKKARITMMAAGIIQTLGGVGGDKSEYTAVQHFRLLFLIDNRYSQIKCQLVSSHYPAAPYPAFEKQCCILQPIFNKYGGFE